GDKLSGGNKTAVESALADLKKAHESKDLNSIDAGVAALNKAWEAASQEMYAAAGAQDYNRLRSQPASLQSKLAAEIVAKGRELAPGAKPAKRRGPAANLSFGCAP
nr:heat shock protein DnaK [Tanacetum cinerariifolium]